MIIGSRAGLTGNFSVSFLEEDMRIREFLTKQYNRAGLGEVEIERSGDNLAVFVNTAKPGLIIGRGGTGLTDLKKKLEEIAKKLRLKNKYGTGKWELKLSVIEIKNPKAKLKSLLKILPPTLRKECRLRER